MKLLCIALAVIAFCSCNDLDPGQKITYRVTGGHFVFNSISPAGQSESGDTYKEWKGEWVAHAGDRVFITAVNSGSPGGMAIQIYRDDRLWIKRSTMQTDGEITVEDQIPFSF